MNYSTLKTLECVSFDTGDRLGYVTDLLVDACSGVIVGLVVGFDKKGFQKKKNMSLSYR